MGLINKDIGEGTEILNIITIKYYSQSLKLTYGPGGGGAYSLIWAI